MPEQPNPLETLVLLSLRAGPSWGYALLGEVERRSEGEVAPDVGTMYRTLARLMERGWVEEVDRPESEESSPGRPRRYYAMTSAGVHALEDEVARMESIVAQARDEVRGEAGA